MTQPDTNTIEDKPLSVARQKCKSCPFCGYAPYVDLGKKGSCQLHGEPFQSVRVYCKNHDCAAKPNIFAGDIYNVGKDKAEDEAISLWNRRAE